MRASGYTCVDVYLPWNFHETAPGRWSFDGRRDVAAFLDLAHEAGLYVVARNPSGVPVCDAQPAGEQVELPLSVAAGEEVWLDVDLPASGAGWLLRLDGAQLRATGWAGGECLGRLWLADAQRPRFSGGDSDVLWIPGAWTADGVRLTLLLRGTAGPSEPVLDKIRLVTT